MKILIASDVDRDSLFAEIYDKEEQWAEVSYDQDTNKFSIRIFGPSSADSYVFDLEEVQEILKEAKSCLIGEK